tara:strand:- start:9254 stop:10417 length:1164 start_codon:yes stop_codon:yes gene_type:complete
MRLAIVTSHPIQYYAPWFKHLSSLLDLHVFYMFESKEQGLEDNEFGVSFNWDIDLLEGYKYTFLKNVSKYPSVNKFNGCDVPSLKKEIKAGGFDSVLVLGWYLKGFWQAIVTCKLNKIPVIVRGDSKLEKNNSFFKRSIKKVIYPIMLRSFDMCLYVGHRNKEYLKHYCVPEKKLTFCPHFINQEFFKKKTVNFSKNEVIKKLNLSHTSYKVLFVGKLIDIKRPLDILRALSLIPKDLIEIELLIVGSGYLELEMKEYCKINNENRVHFLGFKNQTELPSIYKVSDVLILPSSNETWGLVVNEGFSLLTPAIVSDGVGCAPDLIEEGITGEVFRSGDIESLSSKIKKVLSYINKERVLSGIAEKNNIYNIEFASKQLIKVLKSYENR